MCELSEWKRPGYIETLAAIHAACREFKEAAQWQKKAIELGYEKNEDLENAKNRLKYYQAIPPQNIPN